MAVVVDFLAAAAFPTVAAAFPGDSAVADFLAAAVFRTDSAAVDSEVEAAFSAAASIADSDSAAPRALPSASALDIHIGDMDMAGDIRIILIIILMAMA